jgi:alkylhydroperoxidase/carboxymuconolactone decarboxylase family protein YurZ
MHWRLCHVYARLEWLSPTGFVRRGRCDGCITVHAEAAFKLGATKEEIAEALGVAVSVNAGAALVYSTRTLDAFDAASNA